MKQLAIILSLVSLLFVMVTPVLEFTHHHSDEEAAAAHPPSDCDCGCVYHTSFQAIVDSEEIVNYSPAISITDRCTSTPPEPPVFPLYQPPKLFS